MRFLGSLIKYIIYLCVILIAAGVALFWFDTGSWLVQPLAQRAGNFFLAPMRLEIESINGSVRNGFAIEGLKLISDDEALLTLNHIDASPDWDLALNGMEGLPFIKTLNVKGLSSDLEKVMKIASHFAVSEDEKEDETPLNFTLNPFNLSVEDVFFGTPYSNLELNKLTFNEAGNLLLDTKIISGENVFPFKANALVNLNPVEIISSDLSIGNKGRGSLNAALEPLKANLNSSALSLEELLKFAPPFDIKASGRIDGKIFAEADDDNNIKASGVVSMPRAKVMDIPLNFRLPFNWDGKNLFSLHEANLNTEAANLNLSASADISSMKIIAEGRAKNISLTEIGAMFIPDIKLKGEGGNVDFNIDTVASGDILSNTLASINADIPSVSAMGINILQNLAAKIKVNRNNAPKLDVNGRIFGGKLFARGEAVQGKDGNIKPQAVVSIVNLDVPTLLNTFPEAAKSIKKLSGKITTRSIISDNLNVSTAINSEKLSAEGITLTNIKALIEYYTNANKVDLENFSANLGKGLITASANADLKTGNFNAVAKTENLEPKIIPELKQVMGLFNINADVTGNYNNINSISAVAKINAKNVGYDGMKVGNVDLPVSYADNVLKISDAKAILPGGVLNLKGNINLKNTSNPVLDLAASTNGINLANTLKALNLQDKSMPVSGKISGAVDVKGSVKNPALHAALKAENIKAGTLVDMPNAFIAANGDMKKITVNKMDAEINKAKISGTGYLAVNQKNFNNSAVNLIANVKKFDLKPVLILAMGSAPVTGVIDATATVKGTISKPEAELKVKKPIYYGVNEIEDIKVKLKSPEASHFKINAAARVKNFRPEADIDLQNKNGIWSYRVDTKPLDIDSAIETQMPSMAGMAKGYAKVSVTGNTKPNSPININASSKEIKIMDKIKVKNISLPVVFSQADNAITMKNGKAFLSDGEINSGLNVDLTKKVFDGKVKVSHLDFGKLAAPFLPEGEVIGKADAEVTTKGSFGVMPTNFAHGKFTTTPGYIHKMKIIDRVTPTKKISFEKISGSFFWNGNDLFLNPGTGAAAGNNEPLYRYVHVNGSMGIPGKGLKLLCEGRFDLKILDQLLGAMKGVFQYMTGGLAKNVLKDAAGRVFGVKSRDFQNVSFTLANSWEKLDLLNLTVSKPIEDFLPIDILNKDEEKQRDDTQFKLNLKFPVGKGEKSVEEESTTEQFKQQLIDNLFNIGF